ncbi:MAG: transcriptional regulator [Thermoanaerobacteraceae bacterium]
MKFIKIGEKTINIEKIHSMVDKIIEMRKNGFSQQDVAVKFKVDRSFISRLENIGEIRKGGNIAVVGFPIKNKEELEKIFKEWGINFTFLLSEKERLGIAENMNGAELFNTVMDLIAKIQAHDIVIFLGSDKRTNLVEAIFDKDIITVDIGHSPLTEDVYVDPQVIKEILNNLKG